MCQSVIFVVNLLAGLSTQVSAEERLPVDYIKQRLAVLDVELRKVVQKGCQMEDHIRSCLYS